MKGFFKGILNGIKGTFKWGCLAFCWGRIKTLAIIVLLIMYLCK